MSRIRQFVPVIFFTLVFTMLVPTAWAADATAPETSILLDGTFGSNGWYISTVNVSLRTTDLESGTKSTTYQIDARAPIANTFNGSTTNAILNPSFEDGNFFSITNWDKVESGSGFLYQSGFPSRFGYGSAAVLTTSSQYQYWTNVNYAVTVSAGMTYNASSWVSTIDLLGPGAWMEVWERDSTGSLSDKLLATSDKVTGILDWHQLFTQFTIDAGYDRVYLKLGDQAPSGGMAFFDGVTMNAGNDGLTQFSIVENGVHNLTYHSEDNAGNIEPEKSRNNIRIDTVRPQDWRNFSYTGSGNNHTYTMWVDVRDVTSGINRSTAQFRTFDKDGCDCWSNWMNVASIKIRGTNNDAPNGYTGYVTLTTPSYDYGNSAKATMPEVEFRIDDMAGTAGLSPTYALFGPWLQVVGGDIYSGGPISISGTIPAGQFGAQGIIATNSNIISNFTSPNQWHVTDYPVPMAPLSGLETLVPNLDQLRDKAADLPGGRLPSTSGIYKFTGKYTIDHNTLTAGFQNATYNAVIIIDGDLAINDNFATASATGLVFFVSGDVIYSNSVGSTSGAIMAAGEINTGSGDKPLVHSGSLVAIEGLALGRDLGRKGNPNNSTRPAEKIEFRPQYLINQGLARLLSGGASDDFSWQETP